MLPWHGPFQSGSRLSPLLGDEAVWSTSSRRYRGWDQCDILKSPFSPDPAKAGRRRRDLGLHLSSDKPRATGRCVVLCDYTALLLFVTGF